MDIFFTRVVEVIHSVRKYNDETKFTGTFEGLFLNRDTHLELQKIVNLEDDLNAVLPIIDNRVRGD